MDAYIIDTATSYEAVTMLRTLSKGGITFKRATLNVRGLVTKSEKSEDWPLIFDCITNETVRKLFQIRIHMLTCGYNGEGPNALIECLKIAGFGGVIDEKEIINNMKIERIYQK